MKRAMIIRIITCLWTAVGLIAASSGASAAIWDWGCQGQLGAEQVVFNRYSMFVGESKKKLGSVQNLTSEKIDGLIKGDVVGYDPPNTDGSFTKIMEFPRHDDLNRKIILTEKLSRKISSKHRLICGRDESTDVYRKIYRFRRDDEPARDITKQCIEYQLSTRGGRPGCD
jgi:hypothetical protein